MSTQAGTSWTTPAPRVSGYYYYRVKACNVYGCSDFSLLLTPSTVTVQIPTTLPMTTPTNFTVSLSQVEVNQNYKFSWTPVPGAAHYNLKEENWSCRQNPDRVTLIPANTPQPYKIIGTIPNCGLQAPDSVTYWYSLQACDGTTCSEWTPTVEVSVYRMVPIAPSATTTTTTYIHTDGLRSPVAETNAAGMVTSRMRYEPYGAVYGTTGTGQQQGPGYTGHVTDLATGLSYMQQRYYDPVAGRFLSVDPIPASPGSFNRYAYANNNPYKYIDPDGRCPKNLGSNLCIEAKTFDSSRSSGKSALGTPTMDKAVIDQKRVVQTKRGAREEQLGSLNEQSDGSLKVEKISNAGKGRTDSADTASGAPPGNSRAVVHGHTSTSVSDDPYSLGDADAVKILTRPNYAVSQDGRIMSQELDNGRYQVRMVKGQMTDAEIKHYEKATEQRQESFYDH